MAAGDVYYDPGIKVEDPSIDSRSKRRSQFRVGTRDLNRLYEKLSVVSLLAG
jgi:hypothetical protein